nr:ribonuclease H-like domain-containing protein [Tanacetum cinerariifolium]
RVPSNDGGTDSSSFSENDDDSGETSIEENAHPEGNLENLNHSDEKEFIENNDEEIDPSDHIDYDKVVEIVKRSSMQSKLPTNLNDYVIDSLVKFGLNKIVNYGNLSKENLCFTTSLNKSLNPVDIKMP